MIETAHISGVKPRSWGHRYLHHPGTRAIWEEFGWTYEHSTVRCWAIFPTSEEADAYWQWMIQSPNCWMLNGERTNRQ